MKRIDAAGRIGIPIKIREDMGLNPNDAIFINYDSIENQIVIKKENPRCCACQKTENLLHVKKDVYLCRQCLQYLNEKENQ